MKKSEVNFKEPTRQSLVAILIIMYRLYKVLLKQLLPIFVIVLIQGKAVKSQWFIYFIVSMAVIGAVYSLLSFFKYYFFIKGRKLYVKKGVFKKTSLEIPFDRIQSINFEQNVIHRLFDVVKLNVDTAGSASNELQLYALKRDSASLLREIILKNKSEKTSKLEETYTPTLEENKNIIFSLSIGQLLKVGVTENHIRSGFILIFFFFYIYENLREYGFDILEKKEDYMPVAEELAQSLIVVGVLIALFIVVSFMISMVRTILRYFNLHMYRKGDGFVIQFGLLNRKERAAKDEKIQVIKWSQNLLQRIGGIYELVMRQASSVEMSDVKSFKVVGLGENEISQTQEYVFGSYINEVRGITMKPVHHYFFIRRIYRWSFICLPVLLILAYFEIWDVFVILSIAYFLLSLSSWLAFKKKKFGISKNAVRIEGGVFGRNAASMLLYKIQNIRMSQTPFQRRRKLSTLHLFTASGSVEIPEIEQDLALDLKNYLIYVVEISKESWM